MHREVTWWALSYRIQLKFDVQPVQHPPRAVPEKKKPAYEEELESLELENLAALSCKSATEYIHIEVCAI